MIGKTTSLGSELLDGKRPELARALFDYIARVDSIPLERRIFVNRTLRLETIRYVGFDLDWTLADYKRMPLEKLTFELAVERLIDHHGYPEAIRQVEFRPEFPRRGLLIDKEAGTVVRMNRHRYVNRAFFGRQRLGRGELKRLYRYEPIQPASDRFYHLDSLFELPEANLYSELIELANREGGQTLPSSWQVFEDVRNSIDWVHGEGELKSRVVADTDRYLARDPEVGLALVRLALTGRRLILLTNSEWSYAQAICSYLFDGLLPGLDSWHDLFDLALVETGKPEFFRGHRPFVELTREGGVRNERGKPEWGGIYQRGCLDGLMDLIREPGERVLYVGDHIYGDVVTSKQRSTWRTALIVRELEQELTQRREALDELAEARELKRNLSELGHRMDHLRDLIQLQPESPDSRGAESEAGLDELRSRYEEVRSEHRSLLGETARASDRTANRFNSFWGSFFKQGASKTRFARQLETYACLYTSRVSNFLYYGSNRYFRVDRDPMMHELEEEALRTSG